MHPPSKRPLILRQASDQVLTICPAKSYEQLEGWSRRLGGLAFEKLEGV